MTRQRAYQLRHRKAGLCVLCGAKAVNANHCEYHRLSVNVVVRERQRKRKGWKKRYLWSESYRYG